jgi:ribosome-interacting GTPase 1
MTNRLVDLVPRRASTERTIQELRAEIARLNAELANLRAQIEAEQRTKEHSYGIGLAVVCFLVGFLMGTVWVSL